MLTIGFLNMFSLEVLVIIAFGNFIYAGNSISNTSPIYSPNSVLIDNEFKSG